MLERAFRFTPGKICNRWRRKALAVRRPELVFRAKRLERQELETRLSPSPGGSLMDSSVRSRPTHYETLGLTPDASDAEIARAFAREIGRPRVFGGIALVGL